MEYMSRLVSGAESAKTLKESVKSLPHDGSAIVTGTNGTNGTNGTSRDSAAVMDPVSLLELAAGWQTGITVYAAGDGIHGMIRRTYGELKALSDQRVDGLHRATGHSVDRIVLTSARLVDQFGEAAKELEICAVEALGTAQDGSNGVARSRPAPLMLTSGSSGNAKAVAALDPPDAELEPRQVGTAWAPRSRTVLLNWIGLDHVAAPVRVSPARHDARGGAGATSTPTTCSRTDPLLSLRLVDKHRIAYTFAPNFFLAMGGGRAGQGGPVRPHLPRRPLLPPGYQLRRRGRTSSADRRACPADCVSWGPERASSVPGTG
ncbi:hypothetical protein GGR56DRAFT_627833 [Xylariaceae sp. FL0804]|nr:hypothetical protein GGR56DRAFT_627833 [Xylariaceae sp. FL0804]